MTKANLRPLSAIVAIVAIGTMVAIAGSQQGEQVGGIPVFAVCVALAFAVQWIVFVPSYLARTEHYFDLTGSVTYVTVMLVALVAVGNWEARSLVLAGLVAVWALRLGSFLFLRVRKTGADRRFDEMKSHFASFLMTWTLQGLWVLLTAGAALAAITTEAPEPFDWVAAVGIAVWLVGFGIEVVADAQKRRFRRDPGNEHRFIATGLWAWSRHPNYFGEIVLWAGIAVIAAPALSGWQWVTMVSPFFVFILLTRVSGVPLLERRARRQWGADPSYQAYVAKTPVLLPRPPR